MKIDRPSTQPAAAGKTQPDFPAATQERPHKKDGGAHLLHQTVRDMAAGKACRVYVNVIPLLLNDTSETPQDTKRSTHIAQMRDIVKLAANRCKHGCGQDGKRGVFGSLYLNCAFQLISAANMP